VIIILLVLIGLGVLLVSGLSMVLGAWLAWYSNHWERKRRKQLVRQAKRNANRKDGFAWADEGGAGVRTDGYLSDLDAHVAMRRKRQEREPIFGVGERSGPPPPSYDPTTIIVIQADEKRIAALKMVCCQCDWFLWAPVGTPKAHFLLDLLKEAG
jgi:hypothetical protein